MWLQLVGQVLQLPVLRDVGLGKLHQKTVQALQSAAAPQLSDTAATSSGSSLLTFLTQAGKFFGKDPTKWEAVGQGKVHWTGSTMPWHIAWSLELSVTQSLCKLNAKVATLQSLCAQALSWAGRSKRTANWPLNGHIENLVMLCFLYLGTNKCDMFQVDVVEDETTGKRTIKTTTICWGNKLSLLVSTPFYDPRLPANPNDPDLDFSQAQIELNTEADWQKVSFRHTRLHANDMCRTT